MSTTPNTPKPDKAHAQQGDWLLDPNRGWTRPESTLLNWVSQQSGYYEDHLPYDVKVRLTMAMLRAFDAEMAEVNTSSPAATDTKPAASTAAPAQPTTTQPATPSPTEGDTNGKSVSTESATSTSTAAKQPAAKP